ncbi:MAG: phage Gp37/Gp68 family protein [Bacteroidetes bacterium]|nr:MAG: phage Gp37/Gp68 family protein [Bacteroidota bacterium]
MSSTNSGIDWTESTWNPATGCNKVSQGCKFCYAETMAKRLHASKNPRYYNGFTLTLHDDLLTVPLKWKKPSVIFVNSMSDLFHEDIPLDFIKRVFDTMNKATWHRFQVLTKRSERLMNLAGEFNWTPNIWQGVSVEDGNNTFRIAHLQAVPAKLRFLSLEPLIGSVGDIDLTGIHWVITGGESGPGCRPCKVEWLREVRDICIQRNVPHFLKQLGGFPNKRAHEQALLDGRCWREMPDELSQRIINKKEKGEIVESTLFNS